MTEKVKIDRRSLLLAGAATLPTMAFAQTGNQPSALTVAPASQSGLGPRLTMHAIDTFHGTPGAGMKCDLEVFESGAYRRISSFETVATGRTQEPLLVDDALKAGRYQLLMHFEAYFAKYGVKLPSPNFYSIVPIRFVIQDVTQRYHLPVLFSPWGYSYYRGS